MISKIFKKALSIFTQRKPKMSERKPWLPEYADDYTPEKVKLRESVQKIFPKGPYLPADTYELLPKEGILTSSCYVLYVKRGEVSIQDENNNYVDIGILGENCYAFIPIGKFWVENLSKRSNSIICSVTPRPITETYELLSSRELVELVEKDIDAFKQEFPDARRITLHVEKSGTLPGIDAVTK
jgi:hypothetical protein